jgi:uncharacterized membrane protein (DUF373 family)
MASTGLRSHQEAFRKNWLTLSIYERFEQIIALVLIVLIGVVIVMAVWDLSKEVALLAWRGSLDPGDHKTFQNLFGQIMTVLIALEFRYSLVKVATGGEKIIQVKTVLLIAVLALARKFIILEANEYSAATIFALAAVVVALGVTYWLVQERDARRPN